jgi:hypothetical protein
MYMQDENKVADKGFFLSETELKDLIKTRQDYIDGKTVARDWNDIEEELNRLYSNL